MVETALKTNPSASRPRPLGHNPSLCRRRLFCIRLGHIFLFPFNQITLKCLQTDLWNTTDSWRISQWHTSIFGSNANLEILIFVRFLLPFERFHATTGVTTNLGIQKKERGCFKNVDYSSKDEAFALQQRAQEGPGGPKKVTQIFNGIMLEIKSF